MKNEIIELNDNELSYVNGGDGDGAALAGIGLGVVAIGVGILAAPVAGAALVAWAAFTLAMTGNAIVGYGLNRLLQS